MAAVVELSASHLCSCPLPLKEPKEAFLVFVLACLLCAGAGLFCGGGCGERGNSPERRRKARTKLVVVWMEGERQSYKNQIR